MLTPVAREAPVIADALLRRPAASLQSRHQALRDSLGRDSEAR